MKTKDIKSLLFSLFAIWLLLAPMLVELAHVVNKFHAATEFCTDPSAIHLDEEALDCPICEFQSPLFTYQFQDINFDTTNTYFPSIFLFKRSHTKQQEASHYQLRAPPLFV